MNPGELDRRIQLFAEASYEPAQTNNEDVITDTAYGNRWAKYEPVSESESYTDEMLTIRSTAKFTIRYERINEQYKVKYNNRYYDIDGIIPLGRKDYIQLICSTTSITKFKT